MRALFAWFIGIGIVPTVALLRYKFASADDTSAELAFRFAVAYVWPAFALWGAIGFALLRVPKKQFVPLLFLALGIVCGVITAFAAPTFYTQLAGQESRLAARLALDGFICFAAYWYIATGPHKSAPKLPS